MIYEKTAEIILDSCKNCTVEAKVEHNYNNLLDVKWQSSLQGTGCFHSLTRKCDWSTRRGMVCVWWGCSELVWPADMAADTVYHTYWTR